MNTSRKQLRGGFIKVGDANEPGVRQPHQSLRKDASLLSKLKGTYIEK